MLNEQILSYIRTAKASQTPDKTIEAALMQQGWRQGDINEAMLVVNSKSAESTEIPVSSLQTKKATPIPTGSTISSPRMPSFHGLLSTLLDERWYALENVLMTMSLYILASAIALLLHSFIDRWFADPSAASYLISYFSSISSLLNEWTLLLLRIYLAAVIVALPSYTVFFLLVMKQRHTMPALTHDHIAKVLRYITCGITFFIIETTIISVLFGYLNGDVTRNSLIHVFITLLISGIIFAWYGFEEWK